MNDFNPAGHAAAGRAIDGGVVHADQHVVRGQLQVALEHIGVLLDRTVVGREGVLRRVALAPRWR